VSNACHQKRLQLSLKRTTGALLRTQTITSLNLPPGTTTVNVTVGGNVQASQVEGMAIIISG
jgi:hypothetical protein